MKRFFALLLALSLVFTLCACASISTEDIPTQASDTFIHGAFEDEGETQESSQEQTPASSADETPAKEPSDVKTPALKDRFMATWTVDTTPQAAQQFSTDAGTSIDVLREEISNAGAVFGVGYVGYFEYIEETGIDFAQWYEGAASPFAAYYPFFSEIDADHTIGESGYLYCIIGKNYEDAITVTDQSGQVLYYASNGDPILLFCNPGGDGQTADLTLTIASADGTVCTYAPTLDELNWPELLVGDERQLLSWIIQPAEKSTISFDALLAEGWLGISAYGLAGDDVLNLMSWTVSMWDEEKQTTVNFSLSFCPNPSSSGAYDGELLMQCFYDGEIGAQAEWEGWWRIETELDQPSLLQLDLMLMHGDDKAHYEAFSTLSESLWAMVHPNGEILLLMPQSGYSQLPFMGAGVPGVELLLEMG